jgi:hypothetical protein
MGDNLLLVATAYRTIYGIAAACITARRAPHRPMPHAFVGGGVGVVLAIVGTVTTWDRVPSLGPHWYPLALVALAIPCALVGGRLWMMPLRGRSGAQD